MQHGWIQGDFLIGNTSPAAYVVGRKLANRMSIKTERKADNLDKRHHTVKLSCILLCNTLAGCLLANKLEKRWQLYLPRYSAYTNGILGVVWSVEIHHLSASEILAVF